MGRPLGGALIAGVPARVYEGGGRGLLLLGHGGGASKDHETFVALCRRFADGTGLTVVCIDAVEHGDRRTVAAAAGERPPGLPAAWHSSTAPQMVADWTAVVAELSTAHGPAVAYVGFSMGSIFGLPVVAAMRSIEAAVFVVGGIPGDDWVDDPALEPLLLESAAQLTAPQVLLCNMSRDETFPLAGTLRVFDALPDPARKRLALWDSDHQWTAESIDWAIDFVRQQVTPDRRATEGSPPSPPPAC